MLYTGDCPQGVQPGWGSARVWQLSISCSRSYSPTLCAAKKGTSRPPEYLCWPPSALASKVQSTESQVSLKLMKSSVGFLTRLLRDADEAQAAAPGGGHLPSQNVL